MAIKRIIQCDICNEQSTGDDTLAESGFKGWSGLHGVALNGAANPSFCPAHTERLKRFIDELIVEEKKHGVD